MNLREAIKGITFAAFTIFGWPGYGADFSWTCSTNGEKKIHTSTNCMYAGIAEILKLSCSVLVAGRGCTSETNENGTTWRCKTGTTCYSRSYSKSSESTLGECESSDPGQAIIAGDISTIPSTKQKLCPLRLFYNDGPSRSFDKTNPAAAAR